MIRLVLLDIEGTTLPISFVRDVMFPYAARALPTLLEDHTDSQVVAARADIAVEYPGVDPLKVCQDWMAKDIKAAPLKTLQGMTWREGFEDGTLRAALYPDVAPTLQDWARGG
ncbi:putative enolase-phosphatase [Gluconobacter morbifer G707]|uniref:Putative enolase-phosphatase n=1 Tax=Gluconobacter morbifer G707 TaxID=1088869 RepID=G6XME0_9PROT|nr:putative enolase-phosphatase [Gluconobacter morbifer G707]